MGPFGRVVCFLSLFAMSASSANIPAFKKCVNGYLKTSKSPKLTLLYGDVYGDAMYQTFQQRIFNTRFTWQKPAVIAFPVSNTDVSALIKCANKAALRYVARDGGHSYEGLSSLNNGMVIDLSKIIFVNVNKAARLATIGAGQRLGPVYRALFEQGGFMIPGGTCIAVGVSGLTLGAPALARIPM
jgi:FAD/FMN-containing dehydrogenase